MHLGALGCALLSAATSKWAVAKLLMMRLDRVSQCLENRFHVQTQAHQILHLAAFIPEEKTKCRRNWWWLERAGTHAVSARGQINSDDNTHLQLLLFWLLIGVTKTSRRIGFLLSSSGKLLSYSGNLLNTAKIFTNKITCPFWQKLVLTKYLLNNFLSQAPEATWRPSTWLVVLPGVEAGLLHDPDQEFLSTHKK